jgi:hypothetical protein
LGTNGLKQIKDEKKQQFKKSCDFSAVKSLQWGIYASRQLQSAAGTIR